LLKALTDELFDFSDEAVLFSSTLFLESSVILKLETEILSFFNF